MKQVKHTRRGRPPAISKKNESRVVRDYAKLKSIRAVARKWGCHPHTIRSVLQRNEVELPGRRSTIEGHPLLGTASDGDVGRALGVSHDTVARARRKAGIQTFKYTKGGE